MKNITYIFIGLLLGIFFCNTQLFAKTMKVYDGKDTFLGEPGLFSKPTQVIKIDD